MQKRKELLCTSSLKRQVFARSILSESGIDCRVVITNSDRENPGSGASNSSGGPGIIAPRSYEYRIFVYHKDYERASALLRARMV